MEIKELFEGFGYVSYLQYYAAPLYYGDYMLPRVTVCPVSSVFGTFIFGGLLTALRTYVVESTKAALRRHPNLYSFINNISLLQSTARNNQLQIVL